MKILHVDDSPSDQALVSELLESHHVTPCQTLQQAYVLVREHLYDCLLLDLGMPGMDGAEAAEQWRTHGCDRIPLLVLSDTKDPVTRAKCMMSGSHANRFVSKDALTTDGLLERQIREAIRHQHARMERGVSGVFEVVDAGREVRRLV